MTSTEIYASVSDHYGTTARASDSTGYATRVANAFGYSANDLEGMPEDANLGLSCGNPLALANIREGETVCDLGSGAGFDVFQAARKVGRSGKAIGVDFNQDMLCRANEIKSRLPWSENIHFVESPITKISYPDASVDCIISNCVVNLVPEGEKQLVFDEMFRLLKPGGRVAVSDILAKNEMPESVRSDMALYVGCIAGASQLGAYEKYLSEAGFKDVMVVDAKADLNVYWQTDGADMGKGANACCGPSSKPAKSACGPPLTASELGKSLNGDHIDFNQYAGSYKIYAVKP